MAGLLKYSNRIKLRGMHLPGTRSFHNTKYDVGIVGGGIIGLATAQEILNRRPDLKCIVLEKELSLADHQTGHNSGVIHAGIYYKPGSLKAQLCWKGLKKMYAYCDENNIPYRRVGKLIVAVSDDELPALRNLHERGEQNGVEGLQWVEGKDIKQIEPHCQGKAALYSPNTGIVDYRVVSEAYGKRIDEQKNGTIVKAYEVVSLNYASDPKKEDCGILIHGKNQPSVKCRYVITCGGLHSDRLSQMTGCKAAPKLVPFRGDYLVVKPEKSHLVTTNIYPVPSEKFSFLGVHFTPRMDGSIWLGPNAILAFKREGYNLTDFNLKETLESLSYRGFQNFLKDNWKHAVRELYKGFAISKTIEEARKFVPSLKIEDFSRGPSGVRAQAIRENGDMVDDFIFDNGVGEIARYCMHVRNAPSPAATSSLTIAELIVDRAEKEWKAISL